MKKCKYCLQEIEKGAKICPHCRKKQRKLPLPVLIGIIILVFIILVVACSTGDTDSSDSKKNEKVNTTTETKLKLEDGYKGHKEDFGYYIEGYVKNDSSKSYEYVSVEFTAYNKNGDIVDTCLDNNSGLEPNGRWKFKAMCLEDTDNIASFKLKELSGY